MTLSYFTYKQNNVRSKDYYICELRNNLVVTLFFVSFNYVFEFNYETVGFD